MSLAKDHLALLFSRTGNLQVGAEFLRMVFERTDHGELQRLSQQHAWEISLLVACNDFGVVKFTAADQSIFDFYCLRPVAIRILERFLDIQESTGACFSECQTSKAHLNVLFWCGS